MGITQAFRKAGGLKRAARAAHKKLEALFARSAGHAPPSRGGFLGEAILGTLATPFFGAVMGPGVWSAVQTGMDALQCLDEEEAFRTGGLRPVPARAVSRARALVAEYERRLARLSGPVAEAPHPCAW
ncbi:MAG TPA: hypothetical protein DDX54_04850 [Rhodospirillaceae bacterium]|jgi:hypothetical protein|nr:hypothetical protein [Alphaproteobacteria bacterium]HBH26710.1 hypothetical protein [Rhodospirillaceae bacterium]